MRNSKQASTLEMTLTNENSSSQIKHENVMTQATLHFELAMHWSHSSLSFSIRFGHNLAESFTSWFLKDKETLRANMHATRQVQGTRDHDFPSICRYIFCYLLVHTPGKHTYLGFKVKRSTPWYQHVYNLLAAVFCCIYQGCGSPLHVNMFHMICTQRIATNNN